VVVGWVVGGVVLVVVVGGVVVVVGRVLVVGRAVEVVVEDAVLRLLPQSDRHVGNTTVATRARLAAPRRASLAVGLGTARSPTITVITPSRA
jgi:hypothetical protein